MGKEDDQDYIDPFEFARAQLAAMPKPTPFAELAGLPTQDQALTLLRQREVPGPWSFGVYQALIIDTLHQIPSEQTTCFAENGVAVIQAKLPGSEIALKAVIDLSTEPERKPIFYYLARRGSPDIGIDIVGSGMQGWLTASTPESKKDHAAVKLVQLWMSIKENLPHDLNWVESAVRQPPHLKKAFKRERELGQPSEKIVRKGSRRYILRDGFDDQKINSLLQISITDNLRFLRQLGSVVWNAYERAEIVPIKR